MFASLALRVDQFVEPENDTFVHPEPLVREQRDQRDQRPVSKRESEGHREKFPSVPRR